MRRCGHQSPIPCTIPFMWMSLSPRTPIHSPEAEQHPRPRFQAEDPLLAGSGVQHLLRMAASGTCFVERATHPEDCDRRKLTNGAEAEQDVSCGSLLNGYWPD